MIIFPENNLPDQSQDWADTVEREIKRIDKKTPASKNTVVSVPVEGPVGPRGPQGETGLKGEDGADG